MGEDFPLAAQLKKQEQALLAEPNEASPADELKRLEKMKQAAIAAEDYHRAAELRARLSALENKGQDLEQRMGEMAANFALSQAEKLEDGPEKQLWEEAGVALLT